ncbi:UNVERIFIED_CONTAM: hypothetical protein GTU68_029106 [Idotea baltica]|nr:hypothetical protein [Idotea baltica]
MAAVETVKLDEIIAFFKGLQDNICRGIEALDGSSQQFAEDLWQRPEGGGGRTRVYQNGHVLEKGGVNFSHVHGAMPENISKKLGFDGGIQFHATGVSIVIHPSHPMVPIIHMNVRYFEVENGVHWFGGGIDVTPAYIDKDQAIAFHQHLKGVCDSIDPSYYPEYKAWCDRYFFLPHRNETRGIGGIFFDHLKTEKEKNWAFVQAVGNSFVPAYADLVNGNRDKAYGDREVQWQMLRRSRYVEFNLVHDRGTKFGLDTGGRTESILMSMPPMARWEYNHSPEPNTPESETLSLLQPVDWLGN